MPPVETGSEGLTIAGPPRPVSLKEARARGLKTFSAGMPCRLDGTRERTIRGNYCVACKTREKLQQEARDLAMLAKGRQEGKALALRDLEADQRRQQKEAEKAQQEAEKAAAREAALAETEAGRKALKKERQEKRKKEREKQQLAAIRAGREAAAAGFMERHRLKQQAQVGDPKAAPCGPRQKHEAAPAPARTPTEAEGLPPWAEFADYLKGGDDSAPWDD